MTNFLPIQTVGLQVVLVMLIAGCQGASYTPARLQNISIVERGVEHGGGFCSDFDMSPVQVSSFFNRAQIYTASDLHAKFDILPCYVRGTAMQRASKVSWEIRAGATGVITVSDKGAVLFGCVNCDDLFGQTK